MKATEDHGITPQAIQKAKKAILGEESMPVLEANAYVEGMTPSLVADPVEKYMSKSEIEKTIESTRKEMLKAAKNLEFIEAAQLRDEIVRLEQLLETR